MVVAPAFCRLFSPQCVGARFSASPTKERRGARISCRLPSIRPIINTLFVHSNGLGVTPILDPRGPGAILPAEVFYASSRRSFRFSVYCRGMNGRNPNLPRLARQVEGEPELLLAVIDALGSVTPRVRFAASKLLRLVSEKSPEALYPHFDCFVRLLSDKNGIFKWNAMLTLGNLAVADRKKKLDAMLGIYLAPISGKNLISAANTIHGAAAIARAKPYLTDEIAKGILAVEEARYATRECRNVAIGHAISALDECFPSPLNRHLVRSFADRRKTQGAPPATKRANSWRSGRRRVPPKLANFARFATIRFSRRSANRIPDYPLA